MNNQYKPYRRSGGSFSREQRLPRQHQQPRKRIPPIPAKPCKVMVGDHDMDYDPLNKTLVFGLVPYEFPSHTQARRAIWHTRNHHFVDLSVWDQEEFEIVDL